jgi:mRNA interferase RelE/StbE
VADFSVEIKPPARKELERLGDRLLARVMVKIEGLENTPRPPGCKKLKGCKDQWRIRVGDYRIIYIVDDSRKLVSVTRIRHRSEVYEP